MFALAMAGFVAESAAGRVVRQYRTQKTQPPFQCAGAGAVHIENKERLSH